MRIYFSGTPGKSAGLAEYYIDRPHIMTTFHDVHIRKKSVGVRIRILKKSKARK